MKKHGCIVCAWLLLAIAARGQNVDGPDVDSFEVQRLRIESVRQQKTAEWDAEDAACESKFAVTDCQNKVGARRRQVLADLKRQEADLNAQQRRRKGIDQVRSSSEKAAARTAREAEQPSVPGTQTREDRQRALDEKVLNHQRLATPGTTKANASKQTPAQDPKSVEKNRDAYQAKQQALEKRRQERDQRLLDHGAGGPPLPVNP